MSKYHKPLFETLGTFQSWLDNGKLPDGLMQEFTTRKIHIPKGASVTVIEEGRVWSLADRYRIEVDVSNDGTDDRAVRPPRAQRVRFVIFPK